MRFSLDELRAQPAPDGEPLLRFVNVRDALVRGTMALPGTQAFAEVVGPDTRGISFLANDLSHATKGVTLGARVKPSSVTLLVNRVK